MQRATVHLRVKRHDGKTVQGSGFFGVEPGIIITNAHVVDMMWPDSPKPEHIQAVLNSGEEDAAPFTARVIAVDRQADLAVLRPVGDKVPLPPPLEVRSARGLVPTQQVFVFGFPYGEALGKEISINKSFVSTLRRRDGAPVMVQLDRGMNPGNSGGPVVDGRGDVVGVSVAKLVDSEISFAVPGDRVRAVLNGQLASRLDSVLENAHPYRDGGQTYLPVRLEFTDPLNRVREAKVAVAVGGPDRPPSPADAAAWQEVSLKYRQEAAASPLAVPRGYAGGDVGLPALPKGKGYWFRAGWVNGAGEPQWGEPAYRPTPAPVERRPVRVALKPPTGGFTVRKESRWFPLQGGAYGFTTRVDADLQAEAPAVAADGGAKVVVRYRHGGLDVRLDQKPSPANPEFEKFLKEVGALSATLELDGQGNVLRAEPDAGRAPEDERKPLAWFHKQVESWLELATVPPPGPDLKPGDSWECERALLNEPLARFGGGLAHLTCTYLGVRTRAGREEAVIGLAGAVGGRHGDEDALHGRVSGEAGIDLGTGQWAAAEVTLRLDAGDQPGEAEGVITVRRAEGGGK